MRLIITGFGPFLNIESNPSSWLAERSGAQFHVLEVCFSVVDEFLQELDRASFDAILMLGVADKSNLIRVERVGRNEIGSTPDAHGHILGPAPIDPRGPRQLSATLWEPESAVIDDRLTDSVDAGDYLCNYALFRALQQFPEKRVGFLHVVSSDTIPLDDQLEVLRKVIDPITSIED